MFISPQGHPKIIFYNFDPYHGVTDFTDFVSVIRSMFQTKLSTVFCFNYKWEIIIWLGVAAVKDKYSFYQWIIKFLGCQCYFDFFYLIYACL